MQSGRNMSQQDRGVNRGTAKATRNVEEKRKKIADSVRYKQDVKASAVADVDNKGTEPETRRKPQVPTVNKNKPKVITYTKADENRVSYSIQKLLSVYQSTTKADKSPDERRSYVAENKRPKVYAKQSRNTVSKIPEIQGSAKNSSVSPDKSSRRRIFGIQNRKSEEIQTRKTLQKPKLSTEVSRTELSRNSVETKAHDREIRQCDEIIPLLTPDRATPSPLNQIHSFIANYLEEDSENGCESRKKLELFVPENSVNAFPVCSKRATDNIPSSGLVRPELAPSAREFIIMLRRRNSEPYSPKSCILQYSRREEDHPLSSAGSGAWGFGCENYYFWEQGSINPSKPYWQVSLFKSNKSSSALNSGTGLLPLTPPKGAGEILINGGFGPGGTAVLPDRVVKSWNSDLRACKPLARAIPLVSSLEAVTRIPCGQPRVETATKPETRTRGISKDDHYKHPAHLLVYVKPSQKNLVALDSNGNRGENCANRKIHKIKKILGGVSEARGANSYKNITFAVLSAVFLLTGGFAFFVYVLAGRPTIFNLTPPIPGLFRRC